MSSKNKYDNYLFYLCTAKTSPIKYLIELMRNLFPEGVFKCDKQAIKYKNITKSRDVFMDTILNSSSFEEYFCPNEIEIALNMENLFKIVKGIDSNDTLKLYVLKDKPNKLVIHTYNKEENINETVHLNTMDLTIDDFELGEGTVFDSVVIIPTARFQKICSSINNFNERVEIQKTSDQLIFKGCNKDVSQLYVIKPSENGVKFQSKNKSDEIVQGEFILKYFLLFSKCGNLSSTIDILFKNNYPMILQCDVAGLGDIKLLIAPQVNDDEEQ